MDFFAAVDIRVVGTGLKEVGEVVGGYAESGIEHGDDEGVGEGEGGVVAVTFEEGVVELVGLVGDEGENEGGLAEEIEKEVTTTSTSTVSPSSIRVGWIGLPHPPRRILPHRLQPHPVQGLAPSSPSKGTLADSMASLARFSDVVFLIIGFPQVVRRVVLHPVNGVLRGLSSGSVLVDMNPSDPSLSLKIADAARSAGCLSLDAPIYGGDRGARTASLSIFAGRGDDSTAVEKLGTVSEIVVRFRDHFRIENDSLTPS